MLDETVEGLAFRAIAAGALVAILAILAGPSALAFLQRRFREPVKSASPRLDALHAAKQATPTMGGLFILAGILVGVFVLAAWWNAYVITAMLVMLGMAGVGAIDDLIKLRTPRNGLGWRGKLLGQFLVAAIPAIAWGGGLLSPTAGPPWFLSGAAALGSHWLVVPWSMAVIVATANAVNLTDGLDGLATGCLIFAVAAIAVVACLCVTNPAQDLVVVAGAVVGALAGFLPFNLHPARVFMGNVGSLSLGGLLGFLAVATGTELMLPIIGGVFFAEAVSVVAQIVGFKAFGKRVLRCAPLHHHFEFLGWPETKVVRTLWLAGLGCGVLGACLALLIHNGLSFQKANAEAAVAARPTAVQR